MKAVPYSGPLVLLQVHEPVSPLLAMFRLAKARPTSVSAMSPTLRPRFSCVIGTTIRPNSPRLIARSRLQIFYFALSFSFCPPSVEGGLTNFA